VVERPRILLLVTLAETGGAQTYVAQLVPALVERYDVTVAAHGHGLLRSAAERAGARFVALEHMRRPISARHDPLALVELVRLLRRVRPQIVHASSSKAGILGRCAAWLAGVPVRIFTVHGWAFTAAAAGRSAVAYRMAERLVRPLTTVTVCVSESERAAGLAAGTCHPRRTIVIRSGVGLSGRPVASPAREVPRIVSVGRLHPPKDPLTLVRALARLRGMPFEALVVGDGPDRVALEAEIRRLGLGEFVELAGERADVPDVLAGSDIFVLASRSEALPFTALEAMAAGLPVVASRVGGLAELVVEGETGLLVAPGDVAGLASAIERLVRDPGLRQRLGTAGRARVQSEFGLAAFVDAHLELYGRHLARLGASNPMP
jgi:glycosyltransferase involved in cell wall biosynthesis